MLKFCLRLLVRFLKWQDKKLTSIAIRAMKLTRRSTVPIHPKHLFDENRNNLMKSALSTDAVYLDVGSGAGTECFYASQNGASLVYGIEKNSELVKTSKEKLKNSQVPFHFFEIDLEDAEIPLPDQSVQLINFSNVLEHLHNRVGLLRELNRILHAEGYICISIPNKNTPWKRLQRYVCVDSRDDIDHKIEYDKEALFRELSEAGLKISSKLEPIVPSFPINGAISLTACFSPSFYKWLQNWKKSFVNAKPEHSIGWSFLCSKVGIEKTKD